MSCLAVWWRVTCFCGMSHKSHHCTDTYVCPTSVFWCTHIAHFSLLMHHSVFSSTLESEVHPSLLWEHRGQVELQRQWRLSLFSQPTHTTLDSASLHPRCASFLTSMPSGGASRVDMIGMSSPTCPGGCCLVVGNSRHLSIWRVTCLSPLVQVLSISMTLYLPLMHVAFGLELTIFE